MKNLKEMLFHISAIQKKHEELAKINGENFNLFSILDRERNEVTTHSRFLAELLNPKGSHGQGYIFLKLFIEGLKKENDVLNDTLMNYSYGLAKIYVEKSIGKKQEHPEPIGGQIDILIDDGDHAIVVENKIEAPDQPYQLIRYKNYISRQRNKNTIIYLTPNKKYPNEISIKYKEIQLKRSSDYHCITYADFILSWLEDCIKEVYNIPIIRETIRQYIILIQKITNQLNSNEMSEIRELIKLNLSEANKIIQEYEEAYNDVAKSLRDNVLEKIKLTLINRNINIEPKDTRANENSKKTEKFVSIFINHIDGFDGILGIESFNARGFEFEKAPLFIGKFCIEQEKIWQNTTAILDRENLLKYLDEYGKQKNKEKIEDEIVNKVVGYIQDITK